MQLLASFGAAGAPVLYDAVPHVGAVGVFFAAVSGVGAGQLLGTVRSGFRQVRAETAAISENDAGSPGPLSTVRVGAAARRHACLRRPEAGW